MKLMHKFTIILAIAVFTVLGNQHPLYAQDKKINVAASFYPLAEFASRIGGEYVDVINITPAGSEPHDYEPTPMDIKKIYTAKLFVFNGAGVDPWAEKIERDLRKKGVVVIKIMDLVASRNEQYINNRDPHIWLDPVIAISMVESISKALQSIDPEHAQYYKTHANIFIGQLKQLDRDYALGLASCKLHDIVTSHAAFNYLAKRYGFKAYSVAGLSPEEEPSPKTMAQLIRLVQQKHIKYIFFERLVNPKLSDTIARETGAKTLVLDPIEGLTQKEISAGRNYLSIMQENLRNLRQAMECE
ncbi:MAG: metal ABC transporter solute-binding protein, Zn/Mn family [bacterium]